MQVPVRDLTVPRKAFRAACRAADGPGTRAEVPMLTDLAALTPPLLVAAAFLIAAGAFLRHEMRRGKNPAEREEPRDSWPDSAAAAGDNATDQRSASRSHSDGQGDRDPDRGV